MRLTCKKCNFIEDAWRFKEVFDSLTQKSKYYCPKCKKLVYSEETKKGSNKFKQKKLF